MIQCCNRVSQLSLCRAGPVAALLVPPVAWRQMGIALAGVFSGTPGAAVPLDNPVAPSALGAAPAGLSRPTSILQPERSKDGHEDDANGCAGTTHLCPPEERSYSLSHVHPNLWTLDADENARGGKSAASSVLHAESLRLRLWLALPPYVDVGGFRQVRVDAFRALRAVSMEFRDALFPPEDLQGFLDKVTALRTEELNRRVCGIR